MADKDFYDRIADALEIISGDDSHVDDVDKNMDYYKRIADALENIADVGGSSFNNIFMVHQVIDEDNGIYLDKTWNEIKNALSQQKIVIMWMPQGYSYFNYLFITRVGYTVEDGYFVDIVGFWNVNSEFSTSRYYAESADDYPSE